MNAIRIRDKVDALMLDQGDGAVRRSYPLLSLPGGWSFLRMEEEFRLVMVGLAFDQDGRPRAPFPRFVLAWPGDEIAGAGWGYVRTDAREFVAHLSVEVMGTRRSICAHVARMDERAFALKVIASADGKHWARLSEGLSGYAVQPLLAALWYYLAPSMQPVRVEPQGRAGKSVEWLRARSYYSVVHRRHAANRREVPAGAVVGDKTKMLTAHARRAHARILRSPKWGASMGKRVWVRSAWVGPKEWQDAESRQVYRVVDMGRSER